MDSIPYIDGASRNSSVEDLHEDDSTRKVSPEFGNLVSKTVHVTLGNERHNNCVKSNSYNSPSAGGRKEVARSSSSTTMMFHVAPISISSTMLRANGEVRHENKQVGTSDSNLVAGEVQRTRHGTSPSGRKHAII